MKGKLKRMKKIKKERHLDMKYSTNKHLNYRIHQAYGHSRRGEKGSGCVKGAVEFIRRKYPELFKKG